MAGNSYKNIGKIVNSQTEVKPTLASAEQHSTTPPELKLAPGQSLENIKDAFAAILNKSVSFSPK